MTGTVGVFVNNFTTDTLHVYWWWYKALGDSAIVAPMQTAQCFYFAATAWAQIQGVLSYNVPHNGYFTPVFPAVRGDGISPFWWEVDGTLQAPPDDVVIAPRFPRGGC